MAASSAKDPLPSAGKLKAPIHKEDGETSNGSENSDEYILRLYWYPISLAADLVAGDVTGHHILGDPIVLFRDKDGRASCLADVCAHRSAPLSIGTVREGHLECKYHGWQYDGEGKVVHIPALLQTAKIPVNAYTYKYPCVERDGLVWIWPGPVENADVSKIPCMLPGGNDLAFGAPFDMAVDLDIDHSLMCENLLDPAHIPFAHEGTLGKRKDACPLKMEVESESRPTIIRGTLSRPGRDDSAPSDNEPRSVFEFHAPCTIKLFHKFKKTWKFQQVMHCVPIRPGHMRIIYRHDRNFLTWLDKVPFMNRRNETMSKTIIFQDYELLHGQQVRLRQGASTWHSPIQVDKLPKMYRNWLRTALKTANPYFTGYSQDVEDMCKDGDASSFMPQRNGCLLSACEVYAPGDGDVIIPKQRHVDNSAYYMTANPQPSQRYKTSFTFANKILQLAPLCVAIVAVTWAVMHHTES